MKKYMAFLSEIDGQKVFNRVVKLARDHKFYVDQKLVINAMLEEGTTPNPYKKGLVDANSAKIEDELRFLVQKKLNS